MAKKNKKPAKRKNEMLTIVINALADLIIGTLLILIQKMIED